LHLQKLFQAVEEARALLAEGAAAASLQRHKQLALPADAQPSQQRTSRRQRSQAPDNQQLQQQKRQQQQQPSKPAQQVPAVPVPYPPPIREDVGKSSKHLLKWLKAAAAGPMVRHTTQLSSTSTRSGTSRNSSSCSRIM
jgi:hypothetical protein